MCNLCMRLWHWVADTFPCAVIPLGFSPIIP